MKWLSFKQTASCFVFAGFILSWSMFLFACDTAGSGDGKPDSSSFKVQTISDNLPWSERVALTTIKENPQSYMVDFQEKPKWNYTGGLVMLAMQETWKRTGKEEYYAYAKSYADSLIDEEGNIHGGYSIYDFNIDHITPGRILFPILERTGDKRYEKALGTLRQQLAWQPRTTDGGFWHKLRYPWQMWLDGLYMGAPFYADYARRYGQPEAYDDIARQLILMETHSRDSKTGLLYHGWDESKIQLWANQESGHSPHFWGRAMGWYSMALVDVLDFFPQDHPQRQAIIDILNRLAAAVTPYQDSDTGLWYQIVDQGTREGNYLEATVSSMFAYSLIKGVKKGYIDPKYRDVATKAYQGIIDHLIKIGPNGEVIIQKCCSVAGLGGDPYRDGSYKYYVSEPVRDNDPKAVGPFILASLELEEVKLTAR